MNFSRQLPFERFISPTDVLLVIFQMSAGIHSGIHVECQSSLNKTEIGRQILLRFSDTKFHKIYINLFSGCYLWTDLHSDANIRNVLTRCEHVRLRSVLTCDTGTGGLQQLGRPDVFLWKTLIFTFYASRPSAVIYCVGNM